MSLNSLASTALARDTRRSVVLARDSDESGIPRDDVNNALSALIEYLPAETITLYLAVAGAFPALQSSIPGLTEKNLYWTFVWLTPVLFALIYAGKRRAAKQPRFPELRLWPWWPMIAATFAFMAWGLTAPNRAYFQGEQGDVIVGLVAIVASTLLGVIGRLVGTPEPTQG